MSISQPKATVVFVHGARYDPSCFDMVRAQLAQYSYPSTAVALPSTGSPTPSKQTHLEDVAKVRKTIEQLVLDEGKDVILVVFSYGGVPASGSVEGLDKAAIVKNEGKGGIIARVFISAFLPLKGESMLDASKDFASPSQQVEVRVQSITFSIFDMRLEYIRLSNTWHIGYSNMCICCISNTPATYSSS